MLNLNHQQPDTDKIYLYAKDPLEAKYQLLTNKRESAGIKIFNNSKFYWILEWCGWSKIWTKQPKWESEKKSFFWSCDCWYA